MLEADRYFDKVGAFVCGSEWPEIYKERYGENLVQFLIKDEASYVGGPNTPEGAPFIVLNKFLFEHGLAPIAHEITHVVHSHNNPSLREGFANYCHERFGSNPTTFSFGVDIYALSKLYMSAQFDDVWEQIGAGGETPAMSSDLRTCFYSLSHCFVKYLIDTHGAERFLALYKAYGSDKDYFKVYGKDLALLKEEWREHILAYGVTLTYADISGQAKQTFLKCGMQESYADNLISSVFGGIAED